MPLYEYDAFPFRPFIGPRAVMNDDPQPYGKWDYAQDLGDDPAVPPPYIGQGSLVATLNPTETTGLAVSGITLPDYGGVWVGPNGAGEGWEYISYQNTGGLRRGDNGMASGYHTAGAPVYFWYPLDMNNGTLQVSFESTDTFSARQWTAKIGGVKSPTMILKPEHYLLITGNVYDEFTGDDEMPLLLFGLIERVRMTQDTAGWAEWEVDIVSVAHILQGTTIPGIRLGPLDIAREASASASSTLGAAWKLSLPQRYEVEADLIPEIDLVELQEDLGPQYLVDGNLNTLWVSDGWLGDNNLFRNDINVHNSWASLFFYPPPSSLIGTRYIEIISHDGLDFTWYWVYSKYHYPFHSSGATRGHWYQAVRTNFFESNDIDVDSLSGSEDRVIIAESADMFRKLFPAAHPKFLIDASISSIVPDPDAVRRLWWEGGAIFMAWSSPENSAGYLVAWGDVTETELGDAWDDHGTTDFGLPDVEWIDSLAGMKPGMVLRRDFTQPSGTMDFIADYIHHPGYEINQDPHESPAEWIKISLPKMTHVLLDDIDGDSTEIFVVDGQGIPNVEGLSKDGEGGAIYIDDEIITYTGKDYYAGKLTGCDVASKHKAGSKIWVRWQTSWYGRAIPTNPSTTDPYMRPFQDKIFDLATDAYPISKLSWGRGYYAGGINRQPYLGEFFWRFSLYENARAPDSPSHENDYLTETVVDSNTWPVDIDIPNASALLEDEFDPAGDGFRPRTLLMQMAKMFRDGVAVTARPMLNYVKVDVDMRYFNPDTWIPSVLGIGFANHTLIRMVMEHAGMYPFVFSNFEPDPPVPWFARRYGATERETAWKVAVDMAEYGSSIIDVRRNGRIRISPNDYLTVATHDPVRFYSHADISSIEIVNVRASEVGQVRLTWVNGINENTGVVVYPDEARIGTSIIEIGPVLATDADIAQIMAFNHYTTRRFPYNVFIELNDGVVPEFVSSILRPSEITPLPGEVHEVQYDFNGTGETVRKLLYLVSVDWNIQGGRFKTVLGYREIGRETV